MLQLRHVRIGVALLLSAIWGCSGATDSSTDLNLLPPSGSSPSSAAVGQVDPSSVHPSASGLGPRCVTKDPPPEMIARLKDPQSDGLASGSAQQLAPGSVTIAVKFHVIRNTSGAGDVPDEWLNNQINMLNFAYAGNFFSSPTPFQFVNGGVDRTTNNSWFSMGVDLSGNDSAEMVAAKNALHKGGRTVLNVYTANLQHPLGTAYGWASKPWDYIWNGKKDGVVINYGTLPGSYMANHNSGHTLVHEVGHWLGLFHTFGDLTCGGTDAVADTPPESVPTSGCPSANSKDSCPGDGPDPIFNFMDYSDDTCTFQFTAGQSFRMNWAWLMWRAPHGDIDGNGHSDVALTGGNGWGSIPGALAFDWTGRFNVVNPDIPTFPNLAQYVGKPVSADFNGDGYADIALLGSWSWTSIPIAFSDPQRQMGPDAYHVVADTFVPDLPYLSAVAPHAIACDFNKDGRADIAVTGGYNWGSIPVGFSNGDGSFNVTNSGVGTFPGYADDLNAKAVGGDFNGDGYCDIALVGRSDWPGNGVSFTSIPVVFGNGPEAFFPATNSPIGTFTYRSYPAPDFPFWAAVSGVKAVPGDFNGDGRGDIALVGGSGWASIPVAFSNGDGSFSITNVYMSGPVTGDFPWWASLSGVKAIPGDFDGDGFSDIALIGGSGWGSMPIAFSRGDGTATGSFVATNQPIVNFADFAQHPHAMPVGAF